MDKDARTSISAMAFAVIKSSCVNSCKKSSSSSYSSFSRAKDLSLALVTSSYSFNSGVIKRSAFFKV